MLIGQQETKMKQQDVRMKELEQILNPSKDRGANLRWYEKNKYVKKMLPPVRWAREKCHQAKDYIVKDPK